MPSITINFTQAQGARVSEALQLEGTPQEQLDAFKQDIIKHYRRLVRCHECDAAVDTFDAAHVELEVT